VVALALRMLRTRAGSVAGTFLMLALTATVVALAGQVMASGLGAPGPGRYAAADAVVRADPEIVFGRGDDRVTVDVQRAAPLDAAAVARVAAVPGVRAAVGDASVPIAVLDRRGRPLPAAGGEAAHAHGWNSAALTPYALRAGRPPRRAGEIVLDARLARAGGFATGDRVRVVTPAGTRTLTVTGVAAASADQEARQSAAFVTAGQAQALAGREPGFDAIAVVADDGRATGELREQVAAAAAPDAQVLDHRHASAADPGDPRAYEREALVAVVASSGGMTTAIAVFVVAGTLAFVVERRRRELAVLRAVGATPGQVRRLLIGEVAVVGLVAGVAGCAAATLLADPAAAVLTDVGLAPDGFRIDRHWIPDATAIATGAVVAVLASLVAVRRALAVRPGAALVEAAVPPRRPSLVRLLLGLTAAGGGIALLIVLGSHGVEFSGLFAFTFALALAFLAPIALGGPAGLLGAPLRRAGGGAAFLAGAALATGRRRTGAVAAAIALVIAIAATQSLTLSTTQERTREVTAQRTAATAVLVPASPAGLPPSLAREARVLPGVDAAAGVVSTEVALLDDGLGNEDEPWTAAGLDPEHARGALHLRVLAGSLEAVGGHDVAVSDDLARDRVEVGDVLDARLADATPARLRVVAIYDRADGLGDVVLDHEVALAHATAAVDDTVFVAARPGEEARVARGVERLAHADASAVALDRAGYLAGVRAAGADDARAQWVVIALMTLLAAMSVVNSGTLAAAERRRELALARLAGATRRQVLRALTLEALTVALVGVAGGVAVVAVSMAGVGADPSAGGLVVPPGEVGAILAGAAALGLAGMLVPAAIAARAPLAAGAGMRE
jgi:putative ABC transport system permease protein